MDPSIPKDLEFVAGAVEQQGHDDDDNDLTAVGVTDFADSDCPRCRGRGILHVDDGRTIPRGALCACVLEGRQRAAATKRIELLFGKGGARMTIGNFDPGDIEINKTALQVARNYVLNFPVFREEGKGFALQGIPGCGKTHLATGVCAALIKRYNVRPFHLSVPEMLRMARKKFNDPDTADVLDQAMRSDIYLLDDIGAEYHKDGAEGMSWVDEQLFMILNHRLNQKLPTIYTTNLTKRELTGRVDQRVSRRLDTATLGFFPMEKVARATETSPALRNLLVNGS
jgi:DNA replication protein DnaC